MKHRITLSEYEGYPEGWFWSIQTYENILGFPYELTGSASTADEAFEAAMDTLSVLESWLEQNTISV